MTTQETTLAHSDFSELTCENYLDVRDIIARVEALESTRDDWAEWQQGENEMEEAPDPFGADEQAELTTLTDILDDMKGYGGDEQWRGDWYPVTLIRDLAQSNMRRNLLRIAVTSRKTFRIGLPLIGKQPPAPCNRITRQPKLTGLHTGIAEPRLTAQHFGE